MTEPLSDQEREEYLSYIDDKLSKGEDHVEIPYEAPAFLFPSGVTIQSANVPYTCVDHVKFKQFIKDKYPDYTLQLNVKGKHPNAFAVFEKN